MNTTRTAKADVSPIRQRTQYTCMSTSMAMALQALGHDLTEDEVNRVMGARAMQGASWEQALACAQHYGCRATLTMPSTVGQLKKWTDSGTPVMIAWNPEGREWSHASLVYDVTDKLPNPIPDFATVISDKAEGGLWVWVADPNIPNPEKTVRIVSDNDFYSKWFEKWPNYLVRRPACAIEREITKDGKQVTPRTASLRVHLDETLRMATSVRDNQGRVWEPRRGLEGPFKFRGGEVLYYDPREKGGSYYNPLTDTYLDHQEATRITMRSAKDTTMYTASSYDAAMKAWLKASETMSAIRNKIIAAEKALQSVEDKGLDSGDEYNKLMELEEEYDKVMDKHDKAYRSMVMGGWGQKSASKKETPITGPGVTPRNPVVQGLIERGQGGAGKHKDRGRDFDRGNARSPKHRNKDIEAASTPRLAFDNPEMMDAARRIASQWIIHLETT